MNKYRTFLGSMVDGIRGTGVGWKGNATGSDAGRGGVDGPVESIPEYCVLRNYRSLDT